MLRFSDTNKVNSIIAVPGLGRENSRLEPLWSWVSSIMPQDGTSAQIFRLEYHIAPNGPSIWRQLNERGDDLLRILGQDSVRYQVCASLCGLTIGP